MPNSPEGKFGTVLQSPGISSKTSQTEDAKVEAARQPTIPIVDKKCGLQENEQNIFPSRPFPQVGKSAADKVDQPPIQTSDRISSSSPCDETNFPKECPFVSELFAHSGRVASHFHLDAIRDSFGVDTKSGAPLHQACFVT